MSNLPQTPGSISIGGTFRRSASLFADRIALATLSGTLTYSQLDQRSERLASALYASGVRAGDYVSVLSVNRAEFIELSIACEKLMAAFVPLNTRLHWRELLPMIAMTKPKVLFVSPDQQDKVSALLAAGMTVGRVLSLPDAEGAFDSAYERWLSESGALGYERLDDYPGRVRSVTFTSGTTGKAKGVVLTSQAAAIRALRVAQWFELTARDGYLAWPPMFHVAVDEQIQATLMTGGTVGVLPKAVTSQMYQLVESHRLTWMGLLPGVFEEFVRHELRPQYDLSSLRFAFGYGNMNPVLCEQFVNEFHADFWDAYGQSETSFLVAFGLLRPGGRLTGRKLPTPLIDIKLVDPGMNEVPDGSPGECVVRGPGLMTCYFGDPDGTRETFDGGWLHTGDILVRHDDGTMSFVDRKKYIIKTGGENVFPAEVERELMQHPAVLDACVFGVAHARWGEAVKAAVIRDPDQQLTAGELSAWLRQRIGGYKVPKFIQFLRADEVPRNVTGKIVRSELQRLETTDDQAV